MRWANCSAALRLPHASSSCSPPPALPARASEAAAAAPAAIQEAEDGPVREAGLVAAREPAPSLAKA
eukprot:2094582-Alexandrium_andersonii.AAC.1